MPEMLLGEMERGLRYFASFLGDVPSFVKSVAF